MDNALKQFLDYLRYDRNYSQHTITTYQAALDQLFEYLNSCEPDLALNEINGDLLRQWFVSLSEKNLSAGTLHTRKVALDSFFRYTRMMRWMTHNPMLKVKIPQQPKRLPTFIREEEMDKLLNDTPFESGFIGARNKLIIDMLYSAGLRRSELAGLRIESVDLEQKQLKVLGKRNKERIIPFGENLKKLIEEYLDEKDILIGETDYFFVRPSGEPISTAIVYTVVKDHLSLVSTAAKRSPHVLRHSFATAMLNNGSDIRAIKELMGHASLNSTEVYTHASFEQLKKIYEKAHPRGEGEEPTK